VDWSASRTAYLIENGPGGTSKTAATRDGFAPAAAAGGDQGLAQAAVLQHDGQRTGGH